MVNVGLVGAGYWGKNLIRNFMTCKKSSLEVICDKDAGKLAKMQELYPGVKTTENFGDIIKNENLDAVVVSTNVNSHFDLAQKAMESGKSVFVEKPMSDTVDKALKLVNLAKKKGVTLMVGHTFLYSPPVLKIKDIIKNDGIGRVYYISSSRVNLGIHQKDVSVVFDLAPHDFSIISYWLDEVPVKVSCVGYDYVQKGIPDVAFINLIFASGTIAHVETSWLAPSKLRRTTIVGEKKMILYDDTDNLEKVRVFDKGVDVLNPESFGEFHLSYRVGDIVVPRIEPSEPLANEVLHFCECIETGETPRSDGINGLNVVRVLTAAEKSLFNAGGLVEIG